MKPFYFALIAVGALTGCAAAQEAPKAEATTVPFKLSRTQHVVVRVKIDGKGPFHFVVDTGCPVMLISTEAAKKAGLGSDKGAGVIKKLDFEGGLSLDNVNARIETPFQIESMNSMGLPGVELHGLMGYTVLAKYRMEIDYARERMVWTPLAFDPPPLEKLKLKDGGGNLEVLGSLMKVISRLSGLKPPLPGVPRGFVGVELEQTDKGPRVTSVLEGSPAATAGLKAGDLVVSIGERDVAKLAEAVAAVAEIRVGDEIAIAIDRSGEKSKIKLKAASGL